VKLEFKQGFAAVALLTAALSAGASEFWTYVPGDGQLKVNNPSGGSGFAPVSVTGYTGSGGQFNGNFWNAGAMPADSFFRFFCVELTQYANAGPNLYSSSVFADDELRKLYDVAYPNEAAGDFWNGGAQTNFGAFGTATDAAAFQVAVWNIFLDNDLSLSGGSFQWTGASTAVSTAAQALLDQVASYNGDGYSRWTLYKFDSGRYQNYLSATYDVPEPTTLGLLAVALAGLGAARGRRRAA
jgi:PEP-CTERM motif